MKDAQIGSQLFEQDTYQLGSEGNLHNSFGKNGKINLKIRNWEFFSVDFLDDN